MIDLQLMQLKTGQIQPSLIYKTNDPKLLIYQKILLLLCTNISGLFRQNYGTSLLNTLLTYNTNNQTIISNITYLSKQQLMSALDPADKDQILDIVMQPVSGDIQLMVIFSDKSQYKGLINVDLISQ